MATEDDVQIWLPSKNGQYITEAAYSLFHGKTLSLSGTNENATFKNILRLMVPTKLRFFIWQLATDGLPTSELLDQHLGGVTNSCINCNNKEAFF